jgi:hypothetical protein
MYSFHLIKMSKSLKFPNKYLCFTRGWNLQTEVSCPWYLIKTMLLWELFDSVLLLFYGLHYISDVASCYRLDKIKHWWNVYIKCCYNLYPLFSWGVFVFVFLFFVLFTFFLNFRLFCLILGGRVFICFP